MLRASASDAQRKKLNERVRAREQNGDFAGTGEAAHARVQRAARQASHARANRPDEPLCRTLRVDYASVRERMALASAIRAEEQRARREAPPMSPPVQPPPRQMSSMAMMLTRPPAVGEVTPSKLVQRCSIARVQPEPARVLLEGWLRKAAPSASILGQDAAWRAGAAFCWRCTHRT